MRALIRKALVWYIRATGPSPAVLFDSMSDEDWLRCADEEILRAALREALVQ